MLDRLGSNVFVQSGGQPEGSYTLGEAIAYELLNPDTSSETDIAPGTSGRTAVMLGRLIEILSRNNVLTDREVLEILDPADWYRQHMFIDFRAGLPDNIDAYSRASDGTYINGDSLQLNTAGTDEMRFNYSLTRSTLTGAMFEAAATNIALWCRDLTNAVWSATDITVALDQTGVDGQENAASSLTCDVDGGIVSQSISPLGSASRMFSAYMKRITGEGTISISADGSNWIDVELSEVWSRPVQLIVTSAAAISFRMATAGDVIAVDYVQFEDESVASAFGSNDEPTSAILTGATSETRAADSLTFTIPSGVNTLRFKFRDDLTYQEVNALPGVYVLDPTILHHSDLLWIEGNEYDYGSEPEAGDLALSSEPPDVVATGIEYSPAAADLVITTTEPTVA